MMPNAAPTSRARLAPIALLEHVYKAYQPPPTLEINRLFQWSASLLRRASQPPSPPRYVLHDVSLALARGEALGLIGNNGAGKTTLLRLLAGISLPTRGRVRVEGRVSSLIALGAGFHPDLSGRENLYLNCSLMGLSPHQTDQRIDQIVAFAELDDHIDMAVKRYSSGMLARLGFAVAVHLDPDLMLVDEVLSVGDYRFRVKSAAALHDFVQRGTVILASHDLASVERICPRTIWLDQGVIKADGPSPEVIRHYVEAQQQLLDEQEASTTPVQPQPETARHSFDESVQIRSVTLTKNGVPTTTFCYGDTVTVRAELRFSKPARDVEIVIGLTDIPSQVVVTACDSRHITPADHIDQPDTFIGHAVIECRFPDLRLRPKAFGVYIEVLNGKALMPLATWRDLAPRFLIINSPDTHQDDSIQPPVDLVNTPESAMHWIDVNRPV